MRTKICRYCREEFNNIDFPAQFKRMVTCGKVECMKLRRWERLGVIGNKSVRAHHSTRIH